MYHTSCTAVVDGCVAGAVVIYTHRINNRCTFSWINNVLNIGWTATIATLWFVFHIVCIYAHTAKVPRANRIEKVKAVAKMSLMVVMILNC